MTSRPSTRRWISVAAALVVLTCLIVGVAAIRALRPPEPRTEVEAVMRAHTDFMDTYLAGDFGDLWDLISEEGRQELEWRIAEIRDYQPGLPGLTAEELEGLDTRGVIEAALARYEERHPVARREEVEFLRSLRIRSVEMQQEFAWIAFEKADWSPVSRNPDRESSVTTVRVGYVREKGRWMFLGCTLPAPPVKTLDYKLEGFLPKRAWSDEDGLVDAVVTIGPEGLAAECVPLLTARLRECLAGRDCAFVVLDVAPTASWQTAIRARVAIEELEICEIAFAAATTAGPGPGVSVNGIPVGAPYDPERATIDPDVAARVISLVGHDRRPREFDIDSPDPESVEGLPWVIETSFTNRGGVPVRAFRMRDGTMRLILLSSDPAHARRTEPEPEPELLADLDDDPGGTWIRAGGMSPHDVRVVAAVYGSESREIPDAQRVVLAPGERTSRIDTIPWRAGEWFVRAEILDANGRWRTTREIRLGTFDPAAEFSTPEEAREAWDPPFSEDLPLRSVLAVLGRSTVRLAASGDDPEPRLAKLGEAARSAANPSPLRILAALAARRVHRKTGLDLLRALAKSTGPDPALAEAAGRLARR